MRTYGKRITDLMVIEKVMRTLSPRFDYIVVAIEESKNLKTMKIAEFQGSLEVHEQCMNERNNERAPDQASQNGVDQDQSKTSSIRGRGGHNCGKGSKKTFDKRRVQCYNCQKYGHFADECRFNKSHHRRDDDEAHMAQDGDSDVDPVLFMVTIVFELGNTKTCYLDIGCSNHMTNNKEWLVNLDESKKGKVRFANNKTLSIEGVGNVMIRGRNGKSAFISNLLYVPKMKNNLLSLGQKQYIKRVLQRFQMENAKAVSTPLATHFKLSVKQSPLNEAEKLDMERVPYASVVGSLMYAMVCTRPNIADVVGTVSRFLSNPGREYWNAVKWFMRYLHGTVDMKLCFGGDKPTLVGYSDSDMAGDVDSRKSTSGYLIKFARGAMA
uniref:Retrovirus-related Pol polyprotein from transposon TNT 1-94 n=1 Tax=Cajanus cajan TaxID=3821 RepID=A0A151RLF0_CAJCA|nr:Retrovirus-related Pol polyprotein from transposon TNT 1-94 [Cajanus cajan]